MKQNKIVRVLLLVALSLVIALTFVACNNDKNPDKNKNVNNPNALFDIDTESAEMWDYITQDDFETWFKFVDNFSESCGCCFFEFTYYSPSDTGVYIECNDINHNLIAQYSIGCYSNSELAQENKQIHDEENSTVKDGYERISYVEGNRFYFGEVSTEYGGADFYKDVVQPSLSLGSNISSNKKAQIEDAFDMISKTKDLTLAGLFYAKAYGNDFNEQFGNEQFGCTIRKQNSNCDIGIGYATSDSPAIDELINKKNTYTKDSYLDFDREGNVCFFKTEVKPGLRYYKIDVSEYEIDFFLLQNKLYDKLYVHKYYFNDATHSACEIPSTIDGQEVGWVAFYGNKSSLGLDGITSLRLNEGIKCLELSSVFTKLTTLYLPASLKYFDMPSDMWAPLLKDIYFAGTQEQWEQISSNLYGASPLAPYIDPNNWCYMRENGNFVEEGKISFTVHFADGNEIVYPTVRADEM